MERVKIIGAYLTHKAGCRMRMEILEDRGKAGNIALLLLRLSPFSFGRAAHHLNNVKEHESLCSNIRHSDREREDHTSSTFNKR